MLRGISFGGLIISPVKKANEKQMDDADRIEQAELDIWDTIYKLHKAGVRFEVIHFMMVEMVKTLEMQGYAEQWLSEYNKPAL